MKIRMNVTDGDLWNTVKAKRIEAGTGLIRAEDPERAAMIGGTVDEAVERALEREAEIAAEERGA